MKAMVYQKTFGGYIYEAMCTEIGDLRDPFGIGLDFGVELAYIRIE